MSVPFIAGTCPACNDEMLWVDDGHVTCAATGCPEPDMVDRLLAKRDQHVHLIEFRADGYTCQHPLAERVQPGGLFACLLTPEFKALAEPPAIGLYRVPPGGTLADAEQVDPADVDFDAGPPPPAVESALPIGAITTAPTDRAVAAGFLRLTTERQAIPTDAVDLLDYIAEHGRGAPSQGGWPYWVDDVPAVPSRGDVGLAADEPDGVCHVIRVR